MDIIKTNNSIDLLRNPIHLITCVNESNPEDSYFLITSTEMELTLKKCLDAKPIINYEKYIEKGNIMKAIRTAIFNTAPAFKFSEKMEFHTATLLASDLYSTFRYDSYEDILLMLKMARNGELGSGKGRLDHDVIFNVFVPAYFEMKSQLHEQKVNEIKSSFDRTEDLKIDDKALKNNLKRLDEIMQKLAAEKRLKAQVESPIEFVDHHADFIRKLPMLVGKLTNQELKIELKRSKDAKMWDAYKIYELELKSRET